MRTDRTTWDDTNMLIAMVMARRSPDPNTCVGTYVVGPDNRPLGIGYNGTPKGISPSRIPWNRDWAKGSDDQLNTKYPYIEHAERNAIGNSKADLTGAKLYATLYPCDSCAKAIIQAGIKEVIYLDNKYEDQWFTKAAAWMLSEVDIHTRQHQWHQSILSNLETIQNTIHSMI